MPNNDLTNAVELIQKNLAEMAEEIAALKAQVTALQKTVAGLKIVQSA